MSCLSDLVAVQRSLAALPPMPKAYLRDDDRARRHLNVLEAVTRALGRDPFPPVVDGTVDRLTGIPIYLDPDVAPNVLEFRWPDGRVETVDLGEGGRASFTAPGPLTRSWFADLDRLIDP